MLIFVDIDQSYFEVVVLPTAHQHRMVRHLIELLYPQYDVVVSESSTI